VFEPFDWIRLRLTRSRDLRAATYRELFINQPRLPDQFAGNNPWRERTAYSTEPQFERWGQVQVGNPNLKPEKSNTLTGGIVLSPGGWAQGMRLSIDYFTIQVKDGIGTPFTSASPMTACWRDSGNVAATYLDGSVDPNGPTPVNGLIDDSLSSCQEITFGVNPDGSRNLQDIVSYNSARPANLLPYQRRGIDLSWQYMFPVARIFEELPGNLSLTVRGTRALEASGIQINSSLANTAANCAARGGTFNDFNCSIPVELAGQIRSSVFIPGVTASPLWSGTIQAAYLVGDLTTSLSARYVGGARLDNLWSDNPIDPNYKNAAGQFLIGSVDDNYVKPYFNFSLNASYNLKVADMKQFQVFGSINNLFDKSPPFTGGGISGASASYHDTMGRAYRAGVRLKF
jgi:outer membrane receptor protein involved in Fe transport